MISKNLNFPRKVDMGYLELEGILSEVFEKKNGFLKKKTGFSKWSKNNRLFLEVLIILEYNDF